jgi:glutathione S-transferase
VAGSLETNLKKPLAALEEKLSAWSRSAAAQGEAARALGEENARSQREGSELARSLAESLSQEMKSLAGAQASQADRLLAAWAERAAAAQADAEAKLSSLQAALIEDVTSRLQAAEAGRGDAQERLLAKALSGVEKHALAAQEAVSGQVKALSAAAEGFASGLSELKDTALTLVRDVEAKASSTLEAQSQLGLEVAGKVSELADRMRQGSQDVAELAHVAQINQTEMQAGVAMLNSGLSSILERLERQAEAGDGYQSLLAELGKTLSDFQDRAAEVLVDNAMKTQEILMEVLRRQESGPAASENSLVAAQ